MLLYFGLTFSTCIEDVGKERRPIPHMVSGLLIRTSRGGLHRHWARVPKHKAEAEEKEIIWSFLAISV